MRDNGHVSFRIEGYELTVDPEVSGISQESLDGAIGDAQLGVRPEHLDAGVRPPARVSPAWSASSSRWVRTCS